MPLLKIEKVGDQRFMALWKITESYATLATQLQTAGEDPGEVESYKSEQKKLEWLTGRLTLKHLAENQGIPYNGISKNGQGKPLLNGSSAEVSLTHSFPWVAAILDHSEEVGIDLEQPKDKLLKIADRFLNEGERRFVQNDLHKLCICWCAKESLYKIYSKRGLLFKEHLHLKPFTLHDSGIISGSIIANGLKKSYNLRYKIEQEFILAYNI